MAKSKEIRQRSASSVLLGRTVVGKPNLPFTLPYIGGAFVYYLRRLAFCTPALRNTSLCGLNRNLTMAITLFNCAKK